MAIAITRCAEVGCRDGAECRCVLCGRVVCRQHARKHGISVRTREGVRIAWRCGRCLAGGWAATLR